MDENKDLIHHIDTDGRYWLVVPDNLTQDVIYLHHDTVEAGHPGRNATNRAIVTNYYWSAMDREIEEYIQTCLICATIKIKRQTE